MTFDLSEYMAVRQQAVDASLGAVLPPETETPAQLHRAMRYSVFPGGKRIRPVLCLAAAETAGGTRDNAMPAAVAIELLHSYTLIHDDLPCMDDDDTRRGRASCHIAFGQATAVLAGDALQALAFGQLGADPELSHLLITELAQTAGSRGVVGGQADDIDAVGKSIAVHAIERIHKRKTAALFRSAVKMGAITARAPEPILRAMGDYGEKIGLAFQIADDLLDADNGDDERRDVSYLRVYDRDTARRNALELVDEATAIVDAAFRSTGAPLRAIAAYAAERAE